MAISQIGAAIVHLHRCRHCDNRTLGDVLGRDSLVWPKRPGRRQGEGGEYVPVIVVSGCLALGACLRWPTAMPHNEATGQTYETKTERLELFDWLRIISATVALGVRPQRSSGRAPSSRSPEFVKLDAHTNSSATETRITAASPAGWSCLARSLIRSDGIAQMKRMSPVRVRGLLSKRARCSGSVMALASLSAPLSRSSRCASTATRIA